MKVTAALAGASLLVWVGFCGLLAAAFDPPDVGAPDYAPTGFFGWVGLVSFFAALVLVPVALLMLVVWGVAAALRRR